MNAIQYSIDDLMTTLNDDDTIEQYDLNDYTKELYFSYLEASEDDATDPYYCWCGYCYDCNHITKQGTILVAKIDYLGAIGWMDCICSSCAEIYKLVLMKRNIQFNDFKHNDTVNLCTV